jgi:F-type H+-transporting ATPase subunit gamma
MNLRLLKSKIKSIGNVGQITRAMQLVSAVKMKKSQLRAAEGKPYRLSLETTIEKVVASSPIEDHPLMLVKSPHLKKLAIVISSNKGLCGVFNFNLFRFIDRELGEDIKNYQFIVLGNKAKQFLFHYGGEIVADFSDKIPFETNVTALYELILERFQTAQNQRVELLYNQFVSSLVYKPTKKILLPLDVTAFSPKEGLTQEYLVEPDPALVLSGLFSFFVESQIRGAIEESEAAEHSARMIAMKSATDNTEDLVSRLTLLRNSLRQTRITNELLDMNTAKLAVS